MAARAYSWNPIGNKAIVTSWRLPPRTPRLSVAAWQDPVRLCIVWQTQKRVQEEAGDTEIAAQTRRRRGSGTQLLLQPSQEGKRGPVVGYIDRGSCPANVADTGGRRR